MSEPQGNKSTDQRGLPDRVWLAVTAIDEPVVYRAKPPAAYRATEYMRVLSRQEVEKLASDEGVDVQQLLNSYRRTIEGQRKHIARLEQEIREEANAASTERIWQERQGEDYGSY